MASCGPVVCDRAFLQPRPFVLATLVIELQRIAGTNPYATTDSSLSDASRAKAKGAH
jgi:hypothetical protein